MFKKKHLYYMVGGVLVAIIWGYFSDLKRGDIYSFIGRLFFIPLFIVFIDIFILEKLK